MSDWDRQLETGLRDDYDATVKSSKFGTDSRFQNGEQMLLIWELEGTDADGVAFEDTMFLGVGKEWETRDLGKTVVHASGKDKFFNVNSKYGQVIDRAVNEFGIKDILKARGGPYDSGVWTGLKFHFKSEEKDFGGEIGRKRQVLPVKFLGEEGSPGQSVGSSARAEAPTSPSAPPASSTVVEDPVSSPVQAEPLAQPVASPPAEPTVAGEGDLATANSPLRDQLVDLAKRCPTYAEFLDGATDIPGVLDDQDLMGEVVTPGALYEPARAG